MKDFIIYPKKGEPFTLKLKRFTVENAKFILYDSHNDPSDIGFLSFENVSAICVAEQRYPQRDDLRQFEVHLKGRTDPLVIVADCFKMTSQGVKFYFWNIRGRDMKIDGIFIAVSEVVSITPAGGLNKCVD